MANITSLPDELLLRIVRNLDNSRDLFALSTTCKRLNEQADIVLYTVEAHKRPFLLHWACELGHSKVAEKLLSAGFDPDMKFTVPSWVRSRNHFVNLYRAPERTANRVAKMRPVGRFWYPVHCAVRRGHKTILHMLVDYGADVNAPCLGFCTCRQPFGDTSGYPYPPKIPHWTPTHVALCHGEKKTLEYLSEAGSTGLEEAESSINQTYEC
ncbi:hypothetical protein F4775DRAFT_592440 [Biscogniauxia sp. FL1348]|nr:hypothetical protein F4775DRAFT_592440 [Biscogniauxia sp. FL1348]